jgi:hypothetical protein
MIPRKNWASSAEYLRTSTLRKVARLVGHMTDSEAYEFGSNCPFDDIDGGTTETVDDAHAHIIKAVIVGVGKVPPDKGGSRWTRTRS